MQKELKRWSYTKLIIFTVILPIILLSLWLTGVIWLNISNNPNIDSVTLWMYIILWFSTIYILWLTLTIFLSIRRLANLNKSWLWSILFLIPIINIFFLFYLMFAKWNEIIKENENIENNNIEKINKNKTPTWIIFILLILWLWIISNLSNIVLWKAILQIWPWIISWNYAIAILLIFTIILSLTFYWILTKKSWGKSLYIYFLLYWIIILTLNSWFIFFDNDMKNYYLTQIMKTNDWSYGMFIIYLLLWLSVWIVINLIIIKYLVKNKEYFQEN